MKRILTGPMQFTPYRPWSEERKNALREAVGSSWLGKRGWLVEQMWTDGCSFSEIAPNVGTTRSAVAGYIRRRGLHRCEQQQSEAGVAHREAFMSWLRAPLALPPPRTLERVQISNLWSHVGARGNDGPLLPGGWRINELGQLHIHCRCGTEYVATEETGKREGEAGHCVGCGKYIFAVSYYELWKMGHTDRPIQWQRVEPRRS